MTREGIWLELVTCGAAEAVTAFYAAGRRAAIGATPGVRRVRLWHEPEGCRHLLLAELDDVDGVAARLGDVAARHPLDDCPSPQVRAVAAEAIPGAVHGIAREGGEGPLKFVVAVAVAEAHEEEFNRWYDSEHIPILLRHDGWLGARRYRLRSPACEYLTIYDVAHRHILSPQARADVRSTEWSRDVLARVFTTHTKAFFAPAD